MGTINKQNKNLELHLCVRNTLISSLCALVTTINARSRAAFGVKCARIILLFARHLTVRIHGTHVAPDADHIDTAVRAAHVIVLTGVATLSAGILVGGGSFADFPKASFQSGVIHTSTGAAFVTVSAGIATGSTSATVDGDGKEANQKQGGAQEKRKRFHFEEWGRCLRLKAVRLDQR